MALFDAPTRPYLLGLTETELQTIPDTVLDKFDHNILETQRYVLKVEARVDAANGTQD